MACLLFDRNIEGENMGIKGKVDKMVVMACEECKERNYTTTKNKKNNKEISKRTVYNYLERMKKAYSKYVK